MKYEDPAPAGTWKTHFFCRHPYDQRRVYWSVNDDGEREGVQVCRECADGRTVGNHRDPSEFWESTHRLNCSDGSLRTTAGVILYPNWNWSRQQ